MLAYHEPTDEAEGVLSAFARKKSDDNTVYGVVAGYVSFIYFSHNKICHVHVWFNVTSP